MEPRGERRADYRSAQITHAIYTILQSFSGGKAQLSLEDNLLKFQPPRKVDEKTSVSNALVMLQAFGRGKFSGNMNKLEEDLKMLKSDTDTNGKSTGD